MFQRRNPARKPSTCEYRNLEQRKMLAGNVTVVQSDHLYIRGDDSSNQISIFADEDGQITVAGQGDTTINGGTDPFRLSNSTNLDGVRARDAAFAGGIRIITFGGHDQIDIEGIEFDAMSRIDAGGGDDSVRFFRSTVDHDFVVLSGGGDDTIDFVQARIRGDLRTLSANGDDTIRIFNSRTWSNADVFSGAGDDTVTLEKYRLSGDRQRVITFDGDDNVVLRDNDISESGLHLYAGNGRDHVTAEMHQWNEVEGEVVVAGQNGFDVLDMIAEPELASMVNASGFITPNSVEGVWWVYDRGASTNEPAFDFSAGAVEFEETTRIGSIDWLGSYFGSEPPEADNFVIEIFESEAIESTTGTFWYRQPVIETAVKFEIGNNANRIDTGESWRPDNSAFAEEGIFIPEADPRKIFSYSAEIDFEFLADRTYWVSVYSEVDRDSPNLFSSLQDNDFGIAVDFEGEPGEQVAYVPPTGTESEPFENTNAKRSAEITQFSGFEETRWSFTSSDVRFVFNLNPSGITPAEADN